MNQEDQQLYGQYNSAPITFAMLLELEDYEKTMMKKHGRPPTKEASLQEFCKVCGNCMAKIYHGSKHTAESCKSSCRPKIDNIEEIVKSPISLERLASRTIKKSSDSTLSTLGSKK